MHKLAPVALEPLYTAQEARAMDAWTLGSLGVPGIVLMEHAGRATAERALALAGEGPRAILVLTGPGNNGGDGWVAARHLWGRRVAAPVLALKPPGALSGDARIAADAFARAADALGWRAPDLEPAWRQVTSAKAFADAVARLDPALIVDALFGTGLGRPLDGLAGALVEALGSMNVPVLAVDVPSGLPTDGEAPLGPCVDAAATVTFGGRKISHSAEPGRFRCGAVHVVDIGLLPQSGASPSVFRAPPLSALALSGLEPAAHKGCFGHVAVLEGALETAGAARLAAHAALRAGAGLVTMLVEEWATGGDRDPPEVMHRPAAAAGALDAVDVLVVGPGLGRDHASLTRGRCALADAAARDLPAVVDADALPLLLEPGPRLRGLATPHPGEAARLLERSAREVQADRLAAARALSIRSAAAGHEVTWVLKGACPVIAEPQGRAIVCEGGSLPLAVGGSGDVLSGALGALLAVGLPPEDAALLGVVAHQEAGRRLESGARRGALAREVADALGQAIFGGCA